MKKVSFFKGGFNAPKVVFVEDSLLVNVTYFNNYDVQQAILKYGITC